MKKLIFFISLIGIVSFLNSCSAGYVSEEPRYQEVYRPQRPSNDYIWIEGGWNWNSRSQSYIQITGNWVKQDQGRSHKQGHWRKNRHGYQWIRANNY